MPKKKKPKQRFYEHPTAGPLPLVPHPVLPGRVVAYLNHVAVYETNAELVRSEPELEPVAELERGVDEPASQ